MVSLYDQTALEVLRKRLRLDPRVIRKVRSIFLRSFAGSVQALESVPEANRPDLAEAVRFHELQLEESRHSTRDGASKLLFKTRDGQSIESVILRIATGRSSVCVSSQTGCAAGCLFCATGRLKGVRNLTTAEILDQVVRAGEALAGEGRRLRNVVFMGMGEPFHNEDNLFTALGQLEGADGFHLSGRHLLVSTLGIPDAISRLSRSFPGVGLAVSLHSARQEMRDTLMPLARRWPLAELRQAIRERNKLGQPVMIEILMLDGMTDTPADLVALTDWLSSLDVHVNLIPYNPPFGARESAIKGSPESTVSAFLAGLKEAGFKATRRYSLGSDIGAACGQLALRQ